MPLLSANRAKSKLSSGSQLYDGDELFSHVVHDLVDIVHYVLGMSGMKLTEACDKEFRRASLRVKSGRSNELLWGGFEFTTVDVIDGHVRVKQMSIVNYAEGKLLSNKAALHLKNARGMFFNFTSSTVCCFFLARKERTTFVNLFRCHHSKCFVHHTKQWN